MTVSPEKWIDLLTLYGPMALFVFMVFVLLGRARAVEGLSENQKKIQVVAFSLVWFSIFLLAIMIVVAWWRINFPKEFVVYGTIHNLTYPAEITTDQEVYLHRHFVAIPDFEYEWRFISPRRFTGKVVLRLEKRRSDTNVLRYEVPIRSDFYEGTVEIEYDRNTDKMTLAHGGQREELVSSLEPAAGEHGAVRNPVKMAPPSIVYADPLQRSKPEDLIRALDADDPLLRQIARRDLIGLGPGAIPSIEQVLTDPASSYRLRVGVLSALNDISPEAKRSLRDPARCAIAKAANDPDRTLRMEASSLLAAGVSTPSDCPIGRQSILPQPYEVKIPANRPWTNTGIVVRKGEVSSFVATGEIHWAKSSNATAGPDGSSTKDALVTVGSLIRIFPIHGMGVGGLIGCVNKGKPFRVGAKATITMPERGTLFLGINDAVFGNNSGEFNVTIIRSQL